MESMMIYMPIGAALIGLAYMWIKRSWVLKQDAGDGKMAEISSHIYEGALAFLKAEYKLLAIFVVVSSVLLAIVSQVVESTSILIVIAFIFGAITYPFFIGNIGHKITGLKVIDQKTGKEFKNFIDGGFRELLKNLLSYLIFPVIWLLFDKKKQNLYDKITNTYVVEK